MTALDYARERRGYLNRNRSLLFLFVVQGWPYPRVRGRSEKREGEEKLELHPEANPTAKACDSRK